MYKIGRLWYLSTFIAFIFLIISGCNRFINVGWAESDFTPIEEIISSEEKTIRIQGIVTESVPLLNHIAYQVKDNTGSIWVLTNEVFNVGQEVTVQGILKSEEIIIDGQNFSSIYLENIQELGVAEKVQW